MSRGTLLLMHGCSFRVVRCLLLCLLALAALPAAASAEAERPQELLIGIEPEHNIFDQVERYRFLADYLSAQLGVKVNITIMSRYGEVIKRFKTLRLDGAFLTSYTAAMGINKLNLEPVANPVNLNGESTSQGYIFVRKDSGIKTIGDMEGKSIVFVDPSTMEGYLFPVLFLKHHGMKDFHHFFKRVYFSGSHASAILAVLDGRADVGAAKNTTYNKMVQNDPSVQQELLIVARSSEVPECTLCIRKEIAQELRDKLRAVLLDMDKTPRGKEILKKFESLRFVKPTPADFVRIEQMALEAGVGGIMQQGNER